MSDMIEHQFRLEIKLSRQILSVDTEIFSNTSLFEFLFRFYLAFRGVHKESESVECQQRTLSYSPIGAITNELDGFKVALQWFPTRRGAGCSALNHTHSTKEKGEKNNNRNLAHVLLLNA